ncbi:MAG: BatD family protein [Bacteroidota bacterium]|nr:BatD family protein [Bacteroidota bacterium]
MEGEDIFLRAIVDKKNPYQGEQVVVTYKIYTRVAARSPTVKKYPSFPGFWSVDLTDAGSQMQQRREILNGEQYVTAVVSQVALFPQKSGELSIEPMQLDVQVQVQTQQRRSRTGDSFFDRFFDDPFFNNIQYVDKNLVTTPVKINVKPLPLSNRPSSFDGAIGNFNLRYDLDKTETNTNEPLTYKITISGNGNLELIDDPDVKFPPDFEVYDPKKSSNIRKNENGVSGTMTFEYLIIPRVEGTYTIDPVMFSYFDISEEKYKTLSTPEYQIKVNKGQETYSNISYSGVSQEDVKYIGSDIRHIQTGNIQLQKIGSHFFNSMNFYLMIIIPLILAVIFIFVWKAREKKRKDIGLMNYKRATRVARKNLKKAHQFMKGGKEEAFYVEISQALWGYLSNKFNIPRAKLSMENVHQALSRQKIQKENIDRVHRNPEPHGICKVCAGQQRGEQGKDLQGGP